MPNVASSLGTTQRYIPAVPSSQIGRYAGVFMHFPTVAALAAAVADEILNVGDTSPIWTDNQPMSVATEVTAGVYRVWRTGLSHARTVVLGTGKTAILAGNTNTVLATSGIPGGGTGVDGDIAIDAATGAYYTKATGAWALTEYVGVLSTADRSKLAGVATGATVNSPDATLLARANHTGTQPASTISDFSEAVDDRVGALLVAGTNVTLTYNDAGNTLTVAAAGGGGATNLTTTAAPTTVTVNSDTGTDAVIAAADGSNAGLLLPAEKTKLAGIAAGATVNSSDAALLSRINHTGTQPSSTISDFGEAVDDRVGALLVAGTNVTLTYNDAGNTLTVAAAGGGGATNLTTTAAPTTVTVNSDTGTDAVIAAADGSNAGLFLPAEKTKLTGIAAGATANSADAALLARSNHTGSQASTTISDFAEAVDDRVSSLLVAGTNVTLTYNDAGNSLTISAASTSNPSVTVETRSTFPYTIVPGDNGKVLLLNSGVAANVTVAPSLGAGFNVTFIQVGVGRITFLKGAGVAVENFNDLFITAGPYAPVSLIPTGTDSYVLGGAVGLLSETPSFNESVDDRVGALLVAGTNITLTYNDAGNALTIAAAGGGGATNLTTTAAPTTVTINSDTGTDAVIAAADVTNAGLFLPAEKTKLTGVATGATANSSDATLLARANHTGTQAASTISDFAEAVDDRVGALLVAGTNVTLSYNDAGNSLTIDASGGAGATNLTTTAAPTTVTVNSDTGTDAVIAAADGSNAGLFLPAEKTKLTGIATGATANSSDATLLDRANHTGTQLAATISDFSEAVDDRVAALVLPGVGVDVTYVDGSNTLTLDINAAETATALLAVAPTVVIDATTARTLTAADNNKIIRFTSATPVTVTVPTAFSSFSCTLVRGGAGTVTLAASGTTLNGVSLVIDGQYRAVTLAPTGVANTWDLLGAIGDFTEDVQDIIGAMVAAAGGSYNDAAGTITLPGGGDALTSGTLAQFAATTSAQLLGVISDETGTGPLPFANDATTLRGVRQFSAAPNTDNTYHGQVITGLNAGATIAQWEAVYLGSGGTWLLADANGTDTFPTRGIAVAAYVNTNAAIILEDGVVRNDAWAWTPGLDIYLSGTAGGLTQTVPAVVGDKIQKVGYALSADVIRLRIGTGEYLTRSA